MPISSWLESLVSPTVCLPPLVAVGVPVVGKYAGHVTLVDLLTRARLRSAVGDSFWRLALCERAPRASGSVLELRQPVNQYTSIN